VGIALRTCVSELELSADSELLEGAAGLFGETPKVLGAQRYIVVQGKFDAAAENRSAAVGRADIDPVAACGIHSYVVCDNQACTTKNLPIGLRRPRIRHALDRHFGTYEDEIELGIDAGIDSDGGGGVGIDPRAGEDVARETGLEPATSGVTGRRSNQLSYSRAVGTKGPVQRGDRVPAPNFLVKLQSARLALFHVPAAGGR
jgi:hypothetical protein